MKQAEEEFLKAMSISNKPNRHTHTDTHNQSIYSLRRLPIFILWTKKITLSLFSFLVCSNKHKNHANTISPINNTNFLIRWKQQSDSPNRLLIKLTPSAKLLWFWNDYYLMNLNLFCSDGIFQAWIIFPYNV